MSEVEDLSQSTDDHTTVVTNNTQDFQRHQEEDVLNEEDFYSLVQQMIDDANKNYEQLQNDIE